MKFLFAFLFVATSALADSNILRCNVIADGVSISEGSYVELDTAGPFLTLFKNYSRDTGPIYYVKSELVSKSFLSSWRVERSSNCVVTANDNNVEFSCANVNQFSDLKGSMNYDASSAAGHYSQTGLTSNGREMKFEFDFFNCL